MNAKPALFQAVVLAACAVVALAGYGREIPPVIDATTESESASLWAERDHDRLVLTARDLAWKGVRGFGLVIEHRKDMTSAVRAAVADTSARVESTPEGFTLDFGPFGGMGRGRDGVVSLTLASGQETTAPLRVKRAALSGFCLNPVLGDGGSDSPLARYAADWEETTLNAVRSPDAPVMEFALDGDRLVMTVTGTAWNDVQTMTWQRIESQDRTSALQVTATK